MLVGVLLKTIPLLYKYFMARSTNEGKKHTLQLADSNTEPMNHKANALPTDPAGKQQASIKNNDHQFHTIPLLYKFFMAASTNEGKKHTLLCQRGCISFPVGRKGPPENKNSFTYPELDGNSKRVHYSLE